MNIFFARRALLPAILAAAFGGIALALALLAVPNPAASQVAGPGVNFSSGDVTQKEGTTVDLQVDLTDQSTPAAADITVMIQFAGGRTDTTSVTIASGTTSGMVTVTLPNDNTPFTAPDPVVAEIVAGSGYTPTPGGQFVTLTVTDAEGVEVGFRDVRYGAVEGEAVTVTVELKPGNEPASALNFMVSGIPGGDMPVTLSSASDSADVTFTIPDNDSAGTPSPLQLTFTGLPANVRALTGFDEATVEITDDSDPVAIVGFRNPPAAPFNLMEDQSTSLTLELQGSVVATRAVMVTVSDGVMSQVVTIADTESEATFTYTAPGDDDARAAPAARTLQLSGPVNGSVASGSDSYAFNFLDDNDPLALVRFVGDLNPSDDEGEMVTLRAELQQGENATRAIDVRVELSGSIAAVRTLTIAENANFGEIQITLGDDQVQGQMPGPVTAVLVDAPTGGGTGGNDQYDVVSGMERTVITVTDDDVVMVGFGRAAYTFTEGSQVTVTVELKGSVTPSSPITVSVEGVLGQPNEMQTVMLSNSIGSADITFTAPDDNRAAPPADEVLTITSPQGFELAPNLGMTTVSFTDDGDPVARVGFRSPPARLTEGEKVTLNLELTAGGPATRAVTVTVSDGQGFTQMVTIADAGNEASFSYTAPNDDHARVAPAARTLQLSNPVNGSVASGSGSAEITFRDDNDPLATVGFMNPPTHLTEDEMVTLNLGLTAGGPATRAITVTVSDGQGFSRMVTIPNNRRSASFDYTAPGDNHARVAPAARTLQLSAPVNGILAGGSGSATITFRDDNDPLAVVGFAPRSDQQILQGGAVKFVVQLQGEVSATETVQVQLRFSDGRAPQTVTIGRGQGRTEFVVQTISSGPTPPPLTLTLATREGRALGTVDATLVQIPPVMDTELPSAGGVGLGWGALSALLAFALALALAGVLLCRRRAERYTRFLR